MNFFAAKLVNDGDKLFLDADSFKVLVPADRADALKPHVGKAIILGIRPEDVHNPDFAAPGINGYPVPAQVDVTELMGNEILVYLKSGPHNFIARVDPRSKYRIGEDVQLIFNMDNIHIFDKETEQAIR